MHRVIGHAITSRDGKIADAQGGMPQALIVPEDQRAFQTALDESVLVVLGRKGHTNHPNSGRSRLVLTSAVDALASDPHDPKATFWNPQGCDFASVLAQLAVPPGNIAITGGQRIFDLFLPLYDRFVLAIVSELELPDGIACFPDGLPEQVLARAGLEPIGSHELRHGVSQTVWAREPDAG